MKKKRCGYKNQKNHLQQVLLKVKDSMVRFFQAGHSSL